MDAIPLEISLFFADGCLMDIQAKKRIDEIDFWIQRLRDAVNTGMRIGAPLGLENLRLDFDDLQIPARDPLVRIPAEAVRAVLLDSTLNPDPKGLQILGACIEGVLNLAFVVARFRVEIAHSTFDSIPVLEQAEIPELVFHGNIFPGLNIVGIRVAGNLNLSRVCISGELSASSACVGGQLKINNATLKNPTGAALNLDNAEVLGDALMREMTVHGELRALRLRVGGQISMTSTSLSNERLRNDGPEGSWISGDALSLDGAEVGGDMFLGSLIVHGEVRAPGAKVGGQIDLTGASICNVHATALRLDGAVIGAGLYLGRTSLCGEIRGIGMHIGGQTSLRGAWLFNFDQDALILQGTEIKGSLFLDKDLEVAGSGATEIHGKVNCARVTIDGKLSLDGAKLYSSGDDALLLDGAVIRGEVSLGPGLQVWGKISMISVSMTSRLVIERARLSNPKGVVLDLSNMAVDTLELISVEADGAMDLSATKIRTLNVGGTVKPRDFSMPQLQSAQGWEVSSLAGFMRTDRVAACEWLDTIKSADDSKEFSAQPWLEMANLYIRIGQPAEGRWLRYQAAKRASAVVSWWVRPFYWLYRATVGYGNYPLFILVWMVSALIAAGVIASTNSDSFGPTDLSVAEMESTDPSGNVIAVSVTGATEVQPLNYPSFNPVLFALDTALPAVETGQSKAWQITDNSIPLYWFAALKTLSWIFAALLLAGLAGILRRD